MFLTCNSLTNILPEFTVTKYFYKLNSADYKNLKIFKTEEARTYISSKKLHFCKGLMSEQYLINCHW